MFFKPSKLKQSLCICYGCCGGGGCMWYKQTTAHCLELDFRSIQRTRQLHTRILQSKNNGYSTGQVLLVVSLCSHPVCAAVLYIAKLLWQKTEMVMNRPTGCGDGCWGFMVLQCMGASLLPKLCLTNCFHGIIIQTSPVFPVALFLMVSGIVCAISIHHFTFASPLWHGYTCRFPFYYHIKFVFLVWLQLPSQFVRHHPSPIIFDFFALA
jgi:hypothetical protein